MKNKIIWIPVALVVVAVVGAAVWFGNTTIQKGSFPGLQPVKPAVNPISDIHLITWAPVSNPSAVCTGCGGAVVAVNFNKVFRKLRFDIYNQKTGKLVKGAVCRGSSRAANSAAIQCVWNGLNNGNLQQADNGKLFKFKVFGSNSTTDVVYPGDPDSIYSGSTGMDGSDVNDTKYNFLGESAVFEISQL